MTNVNYMGKDGFVWFVGVVEDRNDPQQLGRVRVRCLGFHTNDLIQLPTADLPWAHVMHPVTDPSIHGMGTTPSFLLEGTWVIGFFRDSMEKQQPVIMGSLPGVPQKPADPRVGFNDPRNKSSTQTDSQGKPVYAGATALLASDPEVDASDGRTPKEKADVVRPFHMGDVGARDTERPYPDAEDSVGGGHPGRGGTDPSLPSGGPFDDPNVGEVSQITIAQAARDAQKISATDTFVPSSPGSDPTQQHIEGGVPRTAGYALDPDAGRVSIPGGVPRTAGYALDPDAGRVSIPPVVGGTNPVAPIPRRKPSVISTEDPILTEDDSTKVEDVLVGTAAKSDKPSGAAELLNTSSQDDPFRRYIRQQEGLSLTAYPDPKGQTDNYSIGYGHYGADVKEGMVIDETKAEELLTEDITSHRAKAQRYVDQRFGDDTWNSLDSDQQHMLTDMAYTPGITLFPKFTEAVVEGNWTGNELSADNQYLRYFTDYTKTPPVKKELGFRNETFYDLFVKPRVDESKLQTLETARTGRGPYPTNKKYIGGSPIATYSEIYNPFEQPYHKESGHTIGEPDTSRLGRGKDSETHGMLIRRRNMRRTKIPTATRPFLSTVQQNAKKDEVQTWNEPHPKGLPKNASPYTSAKYPLNHVYESESGHLTEIDDTIGGERLFRQHRMGTFEEIHPDGTKVVKVIGDNYEIIVNDSNVLISGSVNLTVMGDVKHLIKGDYVLEVEGDMTTKVHKNQRTKIGAGDGGGNREEEIRGNLAVNVKDNSTFLYGNPDYASGDISTIVHGNVDNEINGRLDNFVVGGVSTITLNSWSLTAKNNFSAQALTGIVSMMAGDELSMKSLNAMQIKSETSYITETAGTSITETAGTTLDSRAGTVYTIKSGFTVTDAAPGFTHSPDSTNKVDIN